MLPIVPSDTNLRRVRMARGLSLKGFARDLGIHYTQLRRWEAGTVTPRYETILKLAKALGTDPALLFPDGKAA